MLTCTFVMHNEPVMQEKRNVLVTQNVTCQDWPLKLFLSDMIFNIIITINFLQVTLRTRFETIL